MSKGSWREFDDLASRPNPVVSRQNAPKHRQKVRVQKTKVGKGGKIVTVITGLEIEQSEARLLLKKLKELCGTGGTLKNDSLELQGDQLEIALDHLKKEGFLPKKSGH